MRGRAPPRASLSRRHATWPMPIPTRPSTRCGAPPRTHCTSRRAPAWPPTGRKNDAPVKTVSLAWAPGETPTREEMCRAADSFMKAMGWAEHQALIVAHSDTRHPHLHLIINRVHPDTGRTLNDWQERKRAQKWAHDYERQQGAILCPAREARCCEDTQGGPAPPRCAPSHRLATAPPAGASPGKPGQPSGRPGPRTTAASVQRSRGSTAMPVPSNAWPRASSARATAAAP